MQVNTTREKLARGETVLGCGLQVTGSAEIPRAFAAAGFDYVFIDMEHGSFNLETVQDMIRSSSDAGITPIVRVGEVHYSLWRGCSIRARRASSCRASKIPSVLREALSWLRFPPDGKRGYGINPTMVHYETRSIPEIIEHQNRKTLAWCSSRRAPPWSAPTSCSRSRASTS